MKLYSIPKTFSRNVHYADEHKCDFCTCPNVIHCYKLIHWCCNSDLFVSQNVVDKLIEESKKVITA